MKKLYIAHVCLNSKLKPLVKGQKHPDFCDSGFVDISPTSSTIGEQCWKYCPNCESKGFPVIKHPKKKILNENQKNALKKSRKSTNGNL